MDTEGQCLEAILRGKLPSTQMATSAVYDGEDSIYILGGVKWVYGDLYREPLHQILRYDLNTNEIKEVGRFPIPVAYGAAEIDSEENMYYFGGEVGGAAATVWKIPNETLKPEIAHILPGETAHFPASFDGVNGIYLTGGYNISGDGWTPNITRFDISTSYSEVVAQLPHNGCDMMSSTWLNEALYILGGICKDNGAPMFFSDRIHKYTVDGNLETLEARLNVAVEGPDAIHNGRNIYIIGGLGVDENGQFTDHQLQKFDPVTSAVETLSIANFPQRLEMASAVYVQKSNRIYVIGGIDRGEETTVRDAIVSIDLDD